MIKTPIKLLDDLGLHVEERRAHPVLSWAPYKQVVPTYFIPFEDGLI